MEDWLDLSLAAEEKQQQLKNPQSWRKLLLSDGEGQWFIEVTRGFVRDWHLIYPVLFWKQMASVSVVPTAGVRDNNGNTIAVERLHEEMNDMKIRDDKEMEAPVVDGNGTETGHIIVTTIGGRNGQSKQTISYMAERVVGHGSFGIVFQILADAMGLGKTVMTIALILGNLGRGSSGDRRVTANSDDDNDDGKKARRKDPQVKSRPTVKGGTLIICPMTLLGQWKSEIGRRGRARLKEMQRLKKEKIQAILDVQNAAIEADM